MNKEQKQRRGWPAWIVRSRVLILVAVGALAAVSAYHSSRVKPGLPGSRIAGAGAKV